MVRVAARRAAGTCQRSKKVLAVLQPKIDAAAAPCLGREDEKGRMSAIGTFGTSHLHRRMSAIGGKPDMTLTGRYVRLMTQNGHSLHFVSRAPGGPIVHPRAVINAVSAHVEMRVPAITSEVYRLAVMPRAWRDVSL